MLFIVKSYIITIYHIAEFLSIYETSGGYK